MTLERFLLKAFFLKRTNHLLHNFGFRKSCSSLLKSKPNRHSTFFWATYFQKNGNRLQLWHSYFHFFKFVCTFFNLKFSWARSVFLYFVLFAWKLENRICLAQQNNLFRIKFLRTIQEGFLVTLQKCSFSRCPFYRFCVTSEQEPEVWLLQGTESLVFLTHFLIVHWVWFRTGPTTSTTGWSTHFFFLCVRAKVFLSSNILIYASTFCANQKLEDFSVL